ncbi:retention module-containing protein, partial [Methylophaga thiooxydans]|uniref:retention module-containing protein n=1 Tax=Methylophaga thiooxydans TaxID=392484 RepID=UPI00235528F1
MATQIGVIKAVLGTVTATAMDGSTRTLQIGDRVYANELISTGQAGAVEIEFADGSVMDLGRNSQAMLDNGVFDPEATSVADAPSEDIPEDVAAIQQALLDGEDPTEVGEATAAGAGVTGTGNEGHEAVFVNYLNPEVTPEAGFDTIGVNNEIEDLEEEQLIDGTPTAGLVTVLLDEDDLNFSESFSFVQNLLNQIQTEFLSDTSLSLQNQPHFGVRDTTSPGDDFPSPSSTFFSGTLNANYGSDGPGSISFNAAGTQPSGLTSGGQPVQIWVSADGLTLIGYIASDNSDSAFSTQIQFDEGSQFDGAEIIFSAQITDLGTYAFEAGLFGPIDHPDTAEEGSFEENLLLNIAFTITDSDGDAAQGIVQLNVDDDSPVIGIGDESPQPRTLRANVQEDYQSIANADEDDINPEGVGNTDSDGDDTVTTLNLPINYGADGPAAENPVEFSAEGILDQNGNPLTSNGVEVQFTWNAATNTLEGTADGEPVVNVHVDVFDYGFGSDTVVSVQMFDNLDHPIGADGEFLGTEDNLNITLNYTATDADGDQAYGSVSVSIDDDMPVIGTPEAVSVDEEGINGNAGDSYEVVNGVLLIPELENGDLNAALDSDAKQAIKSFVEAGGQLVVNGSYFSEDESLINDIFGFAINQGSIDYNNVPTYSQTANVAGTDYASGPAQLNDADGTYTWDISSLPAEATVMYSDGDDAAVVTIPVGDGQITFLAYDWYNAAPTGSQDSGWTDILNIAVSANGSPADVSVFDNGSYVDSSGGTSAESDNIQATLQNQGHNVSTFTGITLADILAALPEFTTGDLAGEDTVATGSLAINWGADDNNDAESDFDRSVAFTNQIAPAGLTADDQPVSYMISEDGTVLTAYTGELETDSYSEVFTVTLSDEGNGSYEFNLLGNLDHPEANTEDDIDLNFEFIATDSDGDSAVGNFNVTVDDDAPIASGETVEFTIDEDDIRTELSEGNEPNDGDDTDGSFTGSPLSPFDNGPANVSGSVASLVSFGADGAGTITLGENFDALLAQNLTSQGEALSYSVDGNVLSAEADGRDVFTLTLEANGEFTFALSDQLDHADAQGENNLPIDLSSVIVATDADGDAITLESGFVINVTDDVPEQAGLLPEIGIVEDEALPNGNQELNDFVTTIDLGFLGTITIALDGWPDTAIATGSLTEQVSIGADDPATFSLSGDYTQLIAQNLTSDDEPLSYAVQGNTLYAVANQTPIFTLTLDANGDYTFTLMGPLDHADGILEENVLPIDFSTLVVVTDADGDQITLDEDFFIKVVDDSPEVGDNARVRLDDDALEGGNPGGPGDNIDSANVTGTLSHSFGADGGSISWQTSGAPNGFSYEADGDDLLVKQDGETVLTLTLDPQTGEYSVTQNAPIDHRDNGNNNENNQNFNIGYLVTDGDGDTATGSLRVNVDDDTPTVADYEVNTMRIISDDDTVAGL